MWSNNNFIITLDGHDGSGKTTLANLLAKELGGIYVRPFAGLAGKKLIGLADQKDYENVVSFGYETVLGFVNSYSNEILVFDRCWMTVFSLVPENFRHDPRWFPLPLTVLCYSDLDHTLLRLAQRTEEKFDVNYHQYYLDLYLELSREFHSNLLLTDKNEIPDCLNQLKKWCKPS
ncbi:hypothetical protein [Dyadobacter sp. NIV53]|uniref:hypothetical protein n=1 Tax=Dyadobacter sp. NIV53 TaxID=2861765 RepID=UPI001C886482|nr:hypothetical protein [Dyadobacter sp. NIV53]